MMYTKVVRSCLLTLALFAPLGFAKDKPTVEDFNKAYTKFQQQISQGKVQGALRHAEDSYEIGKALFGMESKNTAALAHNYGVTLLQLKKRDAAQTVLREAIDIHEAVYGKDAQELIPVLMDLSDSMYRAKDKNDKNAVLERSLSLTEKAHGKDSALWAQRAVEVGVKLQSKDTLEKSRQYIFEGYAGLKAALGQDAPRVHYAAFQLGKMEISTGNSEGSIAYLKEALAGSMSGEQPSKEMEMAAREFLIHAYENTEQREQATEHVLVLAEARAGSNKKGQLIVKPKPIYPKLVLKKKRSGFVAVRYDVDELGFVKNLQVVDSKGMRQLEKEVLEKVGEYRYIPPFEGGKTQAVTGLKARFDFDADKKKVAEAE